MSAKSPSVDVAAQQIALEQSHLDVLYARLDSLRGEIEHRLARVLREPVTGTPQSLTERDLMVQMHEQRLLILNGVDERLCFGRLDLVDTETHYVGRIGLFDTANNPLLMDWRADAAAAFYQATAATPQGVVRRRNIATAAKRVTGIDDDVLILDALTDATRDTVTGNDSLLTALDSARTGQMRDIVATIQAEQDRIIRGPLRGVLVVQGGPGTGKTVVALHRVAYLLYAHRDRIARSGALVIGPNDRFLAYIDQVLPALGETGVVMRTLGELFPAIHTNSQDPPDVAILKGDVRMAGLIKAAVRGRERVPARSKPLRVGSQRIVMTPADVASAIRRARDTGKPHNEARVVFVKDLLGRLAVRLAKGLRLQLDDDSRLDLMADLRDSPDVRREVNLCWMPVTPAALVESVWSDVDRIAAYGPYLTFDQQKALVRPVGSAWTVSDVPLLDEAAELLGEFDPTAAAAAASRAADRASDVAYAKTVLANAGAASAMLTAEALADRFTVDDALAPLHERAGSDREWAYGHVVIDEAQELSAMQWRMVMRRCPSRSMTIVGDPAQIGSAAAVGSWQDALRPYVADKWTMERLTINYRTPALIMAIAAQVLEAGGVEADPPRSVREGQWTPELIRLSSPSVAELAAVLAAERELLGPGTIAVITGADQIEFASQAANFDAGISVMTAAGCKGLEFDCVILWEPVTITERSTRASQDLYVAMSRPTQRLTIAYFQDLPQLLRAAFD